MHSRPVRISPTQWAVHILGLLLLPGLLVLGRLYAPHVEDGPVLCLWRRLFDWHCPGCGLTRALCLFAGGKWAESVRTHWLIIPVLLAALTVFVHSLTAVINAVIKACIRPKQC